MKNAAETAEDAVKTVKLLIKRSPGAKDLAPPSYMSEGASGMDLCADVDGDCVIEPGEIKLISTGISIHLPKGYEAQIRPRSGLALKHGISLVNTPGTIDSDYRGIISLIVVNLGKTAYKVTRGQRIAQMVVHEYTRAEIQEVEELEDTARSAGGFGHTGV